MVNLEKVKRIGLSCVVGIIITAVFSAIVAYTNDRFLGYALLWPVPLLQSLVPCHNINLDPHGSPFCERHTTTSFCSCPGDCVGGGLL
jgi:hypothetical protein